jgi:CRP/FNR family cyclic AMP-dependent transcriptional regulator
MNLTATRGQRAPRNTVVLQRSGVVRLFDADPGLARNLAPADVVRLSPLAQAEVQSLARGNWLPQNERFVAPPLGLLLLEGVLVRRVTVGRRHTAELLGEGDLIRPHQTDTDEYANIAQSASWTVAVPARLAVLSPDLVAGLAGFDGVLSEIVGRAVERSRALALRLAITQTPNMAERVHLLLWHLADRWGHREGGRVVLGLRLPQGLLAELLGAHRSSVNAALHDLVQRGTIEQHVDTWALCGDPPGELPVGA